MNKKANTKVTQTLPDVEVPQVFAVEMEAGKAKFTRRDFLKAAGVATATMLAGCAPEPTPMPTATITSTSTPTLTPSPTSTPTLTPTPIRPPLSAQEIEACGGLQAHTKQVDRLVATRDNHLLASMSQSENVKLWSLPDGMLLKTLVGPDKADIVSMVMRPDESLLATGYADGTIILWSLPDGNEQGVLSTDSGFLRISSNGKLLASEYLGKITLWSLPEGILLKTIEDPDVMYYCWLGPNGLVATKGSGDTTIDLWSFPDGILLKKFQHEKPVNNVAFTADGSLLITADEGGTIKLWSLPEGVEQKTLAGQSNARVSLSPDGRYFFSIGDTQDTTILLWSLPNGTLLKTLEHPDVTRLWAAFTPDNRLLITGGHCRAIRIWSLPEGKLLNTLEYNGKDDYLWGKISPDSKMLASPHSGGNGIIIWSLPDGNHLTAIKHNAEITNFLYTSDSAALISGDESGIIKLWSLPGGEMLACPFDLAASPEEAQGVTYQQTDEAGQIVEYTLPCGAPIPPGAVCTCNCVAGSHVCSCVGFGGNHYWHPN